MKKQRFWIHFVLSVFAICVWHSGGGRVAAQEPSDQPPEGMGMPQEEIPKMNVEKVLAKMTKRYSLSEAQQAQIRRILIDVKKQTDELLQNSSQDFQDRLQKLRAIQEDESSRISGALSDDQRAKYKKDQKDREDRFPKPGGSNGAPPPPPFPN
jgi:hypothetical protein